MTSKEQAEQLARECKTVYVKYSEIDMPQAVLLAIPLTELLEVAKAAADYEQSNSLTARLRCGIAIKALRATNKIKGL